MEEQVPLVVSHTFRVVSEEADMTGEGGREGGREEGREGGRKNTLETVEERKGGGKEGGKQKKRETKAHVQKVQMSEMDYQKPS